MSHIIPITDFLDPALDLYARLTENQLLNRADPTHGMFIAESPKVIERALNAGCRPISFLVEDRHVDGEAAGVLARCPDTPVYTAPFSVLKDLTGFALTRGALCAMYRPVQPSVASLVDQAARLVILENVVNPTNVGAIFRSAAAMGMDGVLLTPGCSDPLYRRAIRVSMGTVFQIPWTYLDRDTWPAPTIDTLKQAGFTTVSMALKPDSLRLDDPTLKAADKLAIILGTEGDGLADDTLAACDHTVIIPMYHEVDSLNVAAAAAVTFWELGRHRE
ncbi:MAG: RNA methyltransferase [Lachnospiraceae bacterium]|nr:RNA methyltransferase [Lachnospiraceae bacterium]